MLAQFAGPLEEIGPWFYPRMFRECGMICLVLYLEAEAEAAGLRGTGIGCFFDDPVRGLLGLQGNRDQDPYHLRDLRHCEAHRRLPDRDNELSF